MPEEHAITPQPHPSFARTLWLPLDRLYHQSFYLVLQLSDLRHKVARLVRGNRASDDGSRDTAGSAKGCLAGYVDIWNVLVFAKEGEM